MVPKTNDNGPNFIRSLTIKILNKRELQQIAIKHSSDIEYKIFNGSLQKMPSKTLLFLSNRCIIFHKEYKQ